MKHIVINLPELWEHRRTTWTLYASEVRESGNDRNLVRFWWNGANMLKVTMTVNPGTKNSEEKILYEGFEPEEAKKIFEEA